MDARKKLFLHKDPYDLPKTRAWFLAAVKDDVARHMKNCPAYAAILQAAGFSIGELISEESLHKIPPIPTLYYKRNSLRSLPDKEAALHATSSGTKGRQSRIEFDQQTLRYGILMMLRYFSHHKLLSLRPANYIVLGYEPSEHMEMGAAKTAYGVTKFAPALRRAYALRDTGSAYEYNIDGIKDALSRYAKSPFPVRLVGFPSYLFFLVKSLREQGVSLRLNKHSKVILGGGWKEFSGVEIDRALLHELIRDTLGIERNNCFEFYSAVEHPLPYLKCQNGHFHIPIYSRAIVRDIKTLAPLPMGQLGLLSFVSPLVSSMPLASVLTDDLAILYDGANCECGCPTPYFELRGRAGVSGIRTCAADALSLAEEST